MGKKFIPGMELSRSYFFEVVQPLLELHMPGLKYSAGLFGHGSEVIGYDTPRSMDHNWGPQVRIVLPEKDFDKTARAVGSVMCENLPTTYKGFSTHFEEHKNGYLKLTPKHVRKGPVNHLTEFHTIKGFFDKYLSFDPYKKPTERDWLMFPDHSLLEATGGEVWRDDLNFQKYRNKFKYYPADVWKYVMAIQWEKIAWEEPYMARAGEAGDELGAHLISIMVVKNIMRLCFYLERRYIPYWKLFGLGFTKLECFDELDPILKKIIRTDRWRLTEKYLVEAYQVVARMHNRLGVTEKLQARVVNYHGRPYRVVRVERFHRALLRKTRSKFLRNLKLPMGSINQFMDHVHLSDTKIYTQLAPVIR